MQETGKQHQNILSSLKFVALKITKAGDDNI